MLTLSDYVISQIISCINDDIDKICLLITCKRLLRLRRLTQFKISDNRSNFLIDHTKINNNILLNNSTCKLKLIRGINGGRRDNNNFNNNNNSGNNNSSNNEDMMDEDKDEQEEEEDEKDVNSLLLFLPFKNQEQVVQRSNYLLKQDHHDEDVVGVSPSSPLLPPPFLLSSSSSSSSPQLKSSVMTRHSNSNKESDQPITTIDCDSGSATPFIYIVDSKITSSSSSPPSSPSSKITTTSSLSSSSSTTIIEQELNELYEQHYKQYQQWFTHLMFMVSPTIIKPTMIPSTVTHLNLGKLQSTNAIVEGCLPDTLIYLNLGVNFNQTIKNGMLPNQLQQLIFGYKFDNPIIPGSLPNSITLIKFGYYFNKKLEIGSLPNQLVSLTFGRRYNQPIDNGVLPQSLLKLSFGYVFNAQLQPGSLPNHLTHLRFGMRYDRPILPDVLPRNLTHLFFSFQFDQPIGPDILPPRLTHLSFGANFQSPTLYLPQSITHLRLGSSYTHPIQLPNRLKELCLLYQPNSNIQIPQSITHLTWFVEDIQLFPINDILSIKPAHVTHLCLAANYNYPLPCSLNPLFSERDKFGYWLCQSNTKKLIDEYHHNRFTPDNPFVHLALATEFRLTKPLPPFITSLSMDKTKTSHALDKNIITEHLEDYGCFVNQDSMPLRLLKDGKLKRFSVSTLWGEYYPILGTITFHLRVIDNWLLVVSGIDGTGGFIELTESNLNNIDAISLLSTIFLNKYKSRNPSLF